MNIVIRFLLLFSVVIYTPMLHAHCQVPCGIYDDHSRVHTMLEDAQTIQKACVMINELASLEDAHSRQQLARWVSTKEDHATKIITMISEYYLTQRIKPAQNDYLERLNEYYEDWVQRYPHQKLIIDTDDLDFVGNDEDLGMVVSLIDKRLHGLFED